MIEPVERPWALRIARPAAGAEQAGEHEAELELRRHGAELEAEPSPLDPSQSLLEFRFPSEDE